MMRLAAAFILTGVLASAQFVEVQVDAAVREGTFAPLFGLDAPALKRDAQLLLERGATAPLRVGPSAPLRIELGEKLPTAWLDSAERRVSDRRPAEPAVWAISEPPDNALDEALAVLTRATAIDAPAAYYKRPRWFAADGVAAPVLPALELASRLVQTPHRVRTAVEAPDLLALAGVSEDNSTLQVLLLRRRPDDDAPPPPPVYALYIRNLPWGSSEFTIERERLDTGHAGEPAGSGAGRGGLARITARFEGPAVELVTLRKAESSSSPVIRQRRRTN
ncbi:MAG: hypothetical protein R2748_33830 [Bryobacterales bacterium]